MNQLHQCYASAAFGMEGLVSADLRQLGATGIKTENGGVLFNASYLDLYKYNLCMHFSDRLYIILSDSVCTSFEDLYQAVFRIDWNFCFSGKEAINVTCKCTKSTLMSTRDCQSISKKAIIEKLKKTTKQMIFPESGFPLPIHIVIRNNQTRIMLNTSGVSLSRRGYRTWNGEAPLRETLAAALVELSPWNPGVPLHDPCCGTGTILIEASFFASKRSPGLYRHFAMEDLCFSDKNKMHEIKQKILSEVSPEQISSISGSDIDPEALKLARRHIAQAGLNDNTISLTCTPLQKLHVDGINGVFLCNPPYGERLSDQNSCRRLYHDLHDLKNRHPGWHLCAISSDPAFERNYGKKADRKRRLYNGRLECVFYCFD
jgi:putative N6-adenine-specific DNA methylase